MKLVIKNAKIFDPKNGIDGQKGNIYLKDGRISRPFKKADREIDATGLWALPAGIETGIPFASYGLSFYGYKKNFPGPKEISRRYAQMGYTHLHESMMFPSTAPGIHHFLSTLPYQDTSASLCLTLREFGTLIGSNIPPEWAVRFFNICAHRFRALNIRLPESSAHFKKSTLARYNIQAQKVFDYLSRLPLSFPLIVELTSRLLDEDLPQSTYLYYGHIGRAIDGEYAFKQVSKLITEKKTMGDIGLAPQASHSKLKIEAELGKMKKYLLTLACTHLYDSWKFPKNPKVILSLPSPPIRISKITSPSLRPASESKQGNTILQSSRNSSKEIPPIQSRTSSNRLVFYPRPSWDWKTKDTWESAPKVTWHFMNLKIHLQREKFSADVIHLSKTGSPLLKRDNSSM